MKVLRIWLLVILAALLPIRGAMAVAMPCALSGMDPHGETLYPDAAGHGHTVTAHEPVSHDHGDAALHDHDKACQDKCNICSASCSATPLVATIAGVPELSDLASVSFPELSVPAPSFLSDGQERPPRSI